MKQDEASAIEESIIKQLGDYREMAEALKIHYGGKEELDEDELNIIYKGLRRIWSQFRRYRNAPDYKIIIRKITEAQAAVSALKRGKKIEENLERLIEHINTAISLVGSRKQIKVA